MRWLHSPLLRNFKFLCHFSIRIFFSSLPFDSLFRFYSICSQSLGVPSLFPIRHGSFHTLRLRILSHFHTSGPLPPLPISLPSNLTTGSQSSPLCRQRLRPNFLRTRLPNPTKLLEAEQALIELRKVRLRRSVIGNAPDKTQPQKQTA